MNKNGCRGPFEPQNDTLHLTDLNHNLPATSPILRSLSKSELRDPSQKHPPPPRAQVKDRAEDDISVQPLTQLDDAIYEHAEEHPILPVERPVAQSCAPIENLPSEIMECIMGYLAGQLGSAGTCTGSERIRNWNDILRHPRSKAIRELATVSPTWRIIVQKRLFRHVKVQGTQSAVTELGDFFLNHPHLQCHVRHLEVMVPIWEKSGDDQTQRIPTYISRVENHRPMQGYILMPVQPAPGGGWDQRPNITHNFRTASKNVCLSEIFASSQGLFPELFALTVESGHCQRPPQIKYFPSHSDKVLASHPPRGGFKIPTFLGPYLPKLPSVRVLILKGAWSIVRQPSELDVIMRAVPSLNEFHCSFHSFMPMAYMTMCNALQPNTLRRTIKHLSICLEGYYSRDPTALDKWRKVYPDHHLCRLLGSVAPHLTTLNYTGRLCGALFSEMMKSAERLYPERPRLRSIDVLVQNTCRGPKEIHDGVGVHNYRFIQAFEMVVFQAVRALKFYRDVGQVRIRFIDIDAPDPPIQPSFHLEGKKSWGFWSDRIHNELLKTRPDVHFDTGLASIRGYHEGVPRRSHHIDLYRSIAENLVGNTA